MAVVFTEGFDHYNPNLSANLKGWSGNFSANQAGRFGGNAANLNTTVGTARTHALPSTYSTLIAGVAYNPSALPPAATADVFILAAGATLTCRIGLNTSNQLVVRNSAGTTIATGTTVFVAGSWHYIEVKIVVGTSGTVEVHLDGVVEIASTTGNFGTTNVDTIRVQNATSNHIELFDDMYACDTTGSAPNNTFLGDVRVATVYPNADGAHAAWTPTGGGSHFSQVDETPPDGDTTYVSDSTPGDIDSYVTGDIDGNATVYAVQVNLYARKDDASTRQIAPVVRQASSDHVGTTVTMLSTYAFYSQLYDQDPTSSAWTAANVNSDEFGVKEIA